MVSTLQSQLRTLRRQIEGLPADIYCAARGPSSGSIGEHVRHVLDHVRALLDGMRKASFTYDARLRGTRVELEPQCAADEIVRICVAVEQLDDVPMDRAITLIALTDRDRWQAEVQTSIGRELTFVMQHTVHHCAMVAILLESTGRAVPPRFGYAASTPARG